MKRLNITVWQVAVAAVLMALYLSAGPASHQFVSVSSVPLGECVLPVDGEGSLTPGDVANGRYPHLRKVGAGDQEFVDVVLWLKSHGAPCPSRLYVAKGLGLPGDTLSLPTEMHWRLSSGDWLKLDAALVFNFPHVALVELEQAFRFGNPNVVKMYEGPRKPVQFVDASPIGDPWPERCPECYRPSVADKLPYGAKFTDPTGTYEREKWGWAFVSYPVWRRK